MSMTGNLLKISKEKLAELQSDPSLVSKLVLSAIQEELEEDDCLYLYKSWNALHVLLNDGEPGAEADAVMGGTPIGEDQGYGPARLLNDQEVSEISAALANISKSDFESRFDVSKMTDVYSFHLEDAEDEWPIISDYFEELKLFYASAAEQSHGLLLYLV